MKICLYGDDGNWAPSQFPLIERGLLELGHELTGPAECDCIYSNDATGYEKAVGAKCKFNKPAVIAIHDIPVFQQNWREIANEFWNYIQQVDIVTVNSKTTQNQLKELFEIESEITYQPTKLITQLEPRGDFDGKFLFVGRANCPNKRFYLIRELIEKYYPKAELLVVGSENPWLGEYLGILNNDELNNIYNYVDFVLSPSSFEGLGLVAPESILAGRPPIVCNDCAASMEFVPDFACEPTATAMYDKIEEIKNNSKEWNWTISQYQRKFQEQLNYKSVATNIIQVLENL